MLLGIAYLLFIVGCTGIEGSKSAFLGAGLFIVWSNVVCIAVVAVDEVSSELFKHKVLAFLAYSVGLLTYAVGIVAYEHQPYAIPLMTVGLIIVSVGPTVVFLHFRDLE